MTPEALSEAATEKPRRGRPPVIDPKLLEFSTAYMPKKTSVRTRQNWFYLSDTLDVAKRSCPLWFFDAEAGEFPPTLMTEFGRFGDEDEMANAMQRLNAMGKMPVKRAIALVRGWRIGHAQKTLLVVAEDLTKMVNHYLATHPGVGFVTLSGALDMVRDAVDGALGEEMKKEATPA